MSPELFLFLFFLVSALAAIFFRFSGLRLLKFSIPSFVVGMIVLFSYVGIFVFYFDLSHDRGADPSITEESTLAIFGYVSTALLTLCLGVGVMSAVPGVKVPYDMARYAPFRASSTEVFYLAGLAALCVATLFLYLQQVGVTALQSALSGDVGDIRATRSGMGNDFAGGYHWYRLFMRDLLLVATLALFSLLLSKMTFARLILFLGAFSAMAFSAMMAAEKMPMMQVIIGHYLVFIYMRRNGSYLSFATFVFGLFCLAVLSMFYIMFMGAQDVGDALGRIFSRTVTGSLQPFYWILDFFETRPFLGGTSFPNPGGLLPFENFRLAVELMNWARPDVANRGIVGSAPTIFIGEAYANFGLAAVFVLPFLVGCWVYFVYAMICRLVDCPIKIGFLAWATFHFGGLAITGIGKYLFDFTLILVTIVVLGLMALSQRPLLKTSSRRNRSVYVRGG